MQLIDGKATAAQIKQEIADEVKKIVAGGHKRPHLAAILVGHDGGSETYVNNKVIACAACGFMGVVRLREGGRPDMPGPYGAAHVWVKGLKFLCLLSFQRK